MGIHRFDTLSIMLDSAQGRLETPAFIAGFGAADRGIARKHLRTYFVMLKEHREAQREEQAAKAVHRANLKAGRVTLTGRGGR